LDFLARRSASWRIFRTARLDLVLRQNVLIAQATAQREVSETQAVREAFPNYRYLKNTERHDAFHDVVLPKDDPF
jgi:hypothetical protein